MEEEIPPKAEIQAQESQKFEEGEEEEEEDDEDYEEGNGISTSRKIRG